MFKSLTMDIGKKIVCKLCKRSEETSITGPLSIKETVAAHQNCLLYSSGIYCQNSPQFDDLFGFTVVDVMKEVQRGKRLNCTKCKQKGATAGCEVKRCKRTYHYPCAIEDSAQNDDNPDDGKYMLYCQDHHQQREGVNGTASSHEVSEHNQVSKQEESLGSSNRIMLSCNKPRRSSHHDNCNNHEAGPSSSKASDQNSPIGHTLKRKLSCDSKQEQTPSRRRRFRIQDDSSDEEKEESNNELAPLESDLESSANSNTEHRDTESISLLLPVTLCMDSDSTGASFVKGAGTSFGSADMPDSPAALPSTSIDAVCSEPLNVTSSPVSLAPPENTSVRKTLFSSPACSAPSSPSARPPPSPPHLDSVSFWKHCNEAKCTQAIFSDFMRQMTLISNRIQAGQASQKDYDLAVKVMEASGKLEELVSKQAQDLRQRLAELENASVAMKAVMSALRR